jgi:hypothetical protein
MTALWSRYSDEQLALIADFLTRSCDLAVQEIAKLQNERPVPRKQTPARTRVRAAPSGAT